MRRTAWRDGGQVRYIEQPVPKATANGTSATRQWALENPLAYRRTFRGGAALP
ncbi:hypothetical protein [Streptomyces litmocidini]|uniref:hypothetical protein n=1 Tax=Streptomyces litmocidini TaxID=67318 RepID=UPI0036FAF917